MNFNDEIRIKIMKLREKNNLSQSDFAKKLGISRSHMNKLENGTLQISLVYLKQMVDILNVSISQILDENNVNKGEEMMKKHLKFDYEGVNKAILEMKVDEDYFLTKLPKDLIVTEDKLENWKQNAQSGSIIIGSCACRYLIIITETKPHPTKVGFQLEKYGFVNIDHANWELCSPKFDSTDELIEWFASCIENPIIDVLPPKETERALPGQDYI